MNKKQKKLVAIIVAVLVIIGIAIFAVVKLIPREPPTTVQINEEHSSLKNKQLGISMTYPTRYKVSEEEVGTAEKSHYAITLTEGPASQELVSRKSKLSDGPEAILLDVFPNTTDQSAEAWVKGNPNSNFKLSEDSYAMITVAGVPAVAYSWDGKYLGDTVVFSHKGNIYMFSVTSLSPSDAIIEDFATLLQTVKVIQ